MFGDTKMPQPQRPYKEPTPDEIRALIGPLGIITSAIGPEDAQSEIEKMVGRPPETEDPPKGAAD